MSQSSHSGSDVTPPRLARTPKAPRKRLRRSARLQGAPRRLQRRQPVFAIDDANLPSPENSDDDPFVDAVLDFLDENVDDGPFVSSSSSSASGADDDDDEPSSEAEVEMTRDDFVTLFNMETSALRAQSQALAVVDPTRTRTRAKMMLAVMNQFRRVAQLTPIDSSLFATGKGKKRGRETIKVPKLPERSGDRVFTVHERIYELGYRPTDFDVAAVGMDASLRYQKRYKTYPLKDERPAGAGNIMDINVYTENSAAKTADAAIRHAARHV